MKKNLFLFLIAIGFYLFSGIANAQTITSAASGEWSAGTTWVGGAAPTASDDVIIADSHTVEVSDAIAVGRSVSFESNDAKIKMNANARLTVHGNFTLYSTSHNVFSAGWNANDAKIVFAGSEDQVLLGWSTSGGSTSFRDVIIDKPDGSVSTGGNNMRLGIQNSLHIINGRFFLSHDDDIEGRFASSGNFTNNSLPNIIVEVGGELDMEDSGGHHIRSGIGNPIGKLSVHGSASFRSASSNGIRFSDMDVEDGGYLVVGGGLVGSSIFFHPGTITVKSGGVMSVSTISDVWAPATVVDVQAGGTFATSASTTVIPGNFTNNGIFRYERLSSSQQNVVERNYNNLQIAVFNDDGKVWDMAADRSVENLTVVEDGQLILTSGDGYELMVSESVAVISGGIAVEEDSGVVVKLGPSALLHETDNNKITGVVSTERVTAQGVNETFGNIGFEMNPTGASAGNVVVTRTTGKSVTIDGDDSITRYFEVVSTTKTDLNATLVLHYFQSEIGAADENNLKLFRSDNGLTNWVEIIGSIVNVDENTVTISGLDEISGFYTLIDNTIVSQTITSATSGEWSDGTTWIGGVAPTAIDDVIIAAGHTIEVSDAIAVGRSVSFGSNDAKIKMNANARLAVHGNFTLFSPTHNVFSAGWSATDAKIVFAGSEDQLLSGWSTSGGSTSFRDVVIDKTDGSVSTGGNNMRLGIQNSLHIINGRFFLSHDDDIEGRFASSGNFTNNSLPDIIVEEDGEFDMEGSGAHHIRSGIGNPIGKLTVHGSAAFRSASSNGIRLSDIDVENAGYLVIGGGLAGSSIFFHPGTITVKSGGAMSVSTISDVWAAESVVDIQEGGTFATSASTTVIPGNFTDNGIFRYERTSSSQQNVVDRDYKNLQIAVFNDNGKVWNMASDKSVENLTVVEDGQLILTSDDGYELMVSESVALTSGGIAIEEDSGAVLKLGASAILQETDNNKITGVVATERVTAQGVNETFGNIGLEINPTSASAGNVVVTRSTGKSVNIDGDDSITRYFEVVSTPKTGLNATLVFHYFQSEIGAADENNLKLFRSNDGLTGWTFIPGSVLNTEDKTVTVTGLDVINGFYSLLDFEEVLITEIIVTGEGGATTITTDGGTLQMVAEVLPANANDNSVTWSVNNLTGAANISPVGLLTAVSDGSVQVVATANDGSGVTGTLTVTISGQIVLVTEIIVTGEGGATTIATNGGTLQMLAEVLPANATDNSVTWSVNNLTGEANISNSGLLTAVSDGTVEVAATANDDSGVSGNLVITISGQSTGIVVISEDAIVAIYPNPAHNFATLAITVRENHNWILVFYSIDGKAIIERRLDNLTIGKNEVIIDVSDFQNGVYFYNLSNDGSSSISGKLIIKK